MRHFVSLQTEPSAEDALGQPSGDWTALAESVPCRFTFLSGQQLERARFQYNEASIEIEIYRPAYFEVKESMRAVVKSPLRTHTCEIGHVGPKQDDFRKLLLLCKEVV